MSGEAVDIQIDGKAVRARAGESLLSAALKADIYIPHLCDHPALPPFDKVSPSDVCYRGGEAFRSGSNQEEGEGCGLCWVELKPGRKLVLSCTTPVEEGMDILTDTPELAARRRDHLARILRTHPHACLTCAQREGCSLTQCSTNVPEEERCCPQFDVCELRRVAEYVGIREDLPRYVPRNLSVEEDQPLFLRDYNLCVGCLRCVRACTEVVGAEALAYVIREREVVVGTRAPSIEESGCRYCGVCIEVCPTGALRDKDGKPAERKDALVPCVAECPLRMDVPSYVRLIREDRPAEAAAVIREKTPLAMTLGHICARPCETVCRRKEINDPVAICSLKRYALEASGLPPDVPKPASTGKKVAVVGGGPAGLVAAYFLALKGHAVTVFEGQDEPGGMLRWAVPEYRLPLHILRKEMEAIQDLGVKILTGFPVNPDTFVQEFRQNTWDALFLATGAQQSRKIQVEGQDVSGVFWGLEFLREAKKRHAVPVQGAVVVVGGGNVAVDVAMTALRLAAADVRMVCLEKREEMPAYPWEIQEAEEEGIAIHDGWGPLRFIQKEGRVCGLELQRCTSVFDESGNFRPQYDPEERMSVEADSVILAVGQKPDVSYLPPELGLEVREDDTLGVDPETMATCVPGIFAGGEAVHGPGSAVEAMASGRRAAAAIDRYLGGTGEIDRPSGVEPRKSLWMGREEGFGARGRVPPARIPAVERMRSFGLISLGYNRDEARRESERCLRCDIRLEIPPAVLPPEKWIPLTPDALARVPEIEGAFTLLDEGKKTLYIAGVPNLRQALEEQMSLQPEARFFTYEEDPMYTKRESELIQQHLQKHGRLPPGNEDMEDLF